MSWIGDKAEATANVLKELLMQTPAAKLYRQGLPNVLDALLNTREEEWRSKVQAMPKPFDASPEAINRDMETTMAFWNPAGVIGMTAFEKAHKIAQKNAAKMLGLPKNNTAADRAKALGFDKDVYHGGTNDFTEFFGTRPVYATDDPRIADIYANATGRHQGLREVNAGPNVMPLKLRGREIAVSDLGETGGGWYTDNLSARLGIPAKRGMVNELEKHGFDRLKVTDISDLGGVQAQYVIPAGSTNIRSRFAAFDPARKDEANLLAAYFGFPLPSMEGE